MTSTGVSDAGHPLKVGRVFVGRKVTRVIDSLVECRGRLGISVLIGESPVDDTAAIDVDAVKRLT